MPTKFSLHPLSLLCNGRPGQRPKGAYCGNVLHTAWTDSSDIAIPGLGRSSHSFQHVTKRVYLVRECNGNANKSHSLINPAWECETCRKGHGPMQELRAVIYANLKEFGICSLGPVLLLGFQVGIPMQCWFSLTPAVNMIHGLECACEKYVVLYLLHVICSTLCCGKRFCFYGQPLSALQMHFRFARSTACSHLMGRKYPQEVLERAA